MHATRIEEAAFQFHPKMRQEPIKLAQERFRMQKFHMKANEGVCVAVSVDKRTSYVPAPAGWSRPRTGRTGRAPPRRIPLVTGPPPTSHDARHLRLMPPPTRHGHARHLRPRRRPCCCRRRSCWRCCCCRHRLHGDGHRKCSCWKTLSNRDGEALGATGRGGLLITYQHCSSRQQDRSPPIGPTAYWSLGSAS